MPLNTRMPKGKPLTDQRGDWFGVGLVRRTGRSFSFSGMVRTMASGLAGLLYAGSLAACLSQVSEPPLVVTQVPVEKKTAEQDVLDQRYPAGSRVVRVSPSHKPSEVLILSAGLIASGDPLVSVDGKIVYFAGKVASGGDWQIYSVSSSGGQPKPITTMVGGTMDPAIVGNGDLIFSSPVPKRGETWKPGSKPAALYRQHSGEAAQRLTFGVMAAVEPTVLRDGTILFVSARVVPGASNTPRLGLFTINDDGTEVTPYAVDNDGPSWVRRPRELGEGRIGFLTSTEPDSRMQRAETVRSARPFASRGPLFSFPSSACHAIEPDGQGNVLVCLETRGLMGRSMSGSCAVFRVSREARELSQPIFDDPAWNEVEALPLIERSKPMGHVSAIKPALKTGTILCLNANFTRPSAANSARKAMRVRVLARFNEDKESDLGEVALQADGSFMATVPAETPLGFETLDEQGQIIQKLPPSVWLRPGENRSCLGCHEPYNRSPRNVRPIAAGLPAAKLGEKISAAAP